MGKTSILHLSDIHIGNLCYDDPEELAITIVNDLEHNISNYNKIEAVVVTGDIFDKGYGLKENERKNAINFFNKILCEIKEKGINNNISKEDFIFVPGNHDLIRTNQGADFEKYSKFIKEFYGNEYNSSDKLVSYNEEYWFSIKRFKEKKVIVLGLNSCKFEKNGEDSDDYGLISLKQLSEAFKFLKKQVKDMDDYTIVTMFHHHFYPFPEIYTKHGDNSLIRNYDLVIDFLIRNNVKIVLHGHKHTQIVRPVVNDSFFDNPNSLIVVCSAGSIGSKDVDNRAFQIVQVFEPYEDNVIFLNRVEYKGTRCDSIRSFSYPPQKDYRKITINLIKALESEDSDLYRDYYEDVNAKDSISEGTTKIIEFISKIYSEFKYTRDELKKTPESIYLILVCIHYRCILLDKNRSSKRDVSLHNELLELMKQKIFKTINRYDKCDNKEYYEELIGLLSSKNNQEFINKCGSIDKNFKKNELKKIQSFVISTVFFVDLFMTLNKYGEFYFRKEKIDHKTNVFMEENKFSLNIVTNTIKLVPDEDRRALKVEFKCTDPTVHKVAVLIIKDFEMRISKIEENFNTIGLKLYYISPKVIKDKYELDNYNFEAYIPTLMPLLIGENIYKEHNVFIRELIQNSKDAISLRKKLIPNEQVDETIIIKFGEEKDNNINKKFIEISDNGIGMDESKIQRYFTSIGRSFYNSDEYNDMLNEKNTQYHAISSFGIGFLSSFLVSKQVKVITSSCFEENNGLEIEIPNYDGCFFIRKSGSKLPTGTTIRLYEDYRKRIDYDKIVNEYLKKIILNIGMPIKIINNDNNEINISPYNLFKTLLSNNCLENPMFFIPFSQDKYYDYSYDNIEEKLHENPYGILIKFFNNEHKTIIMNEGLLLKEEQKTIIENAYCDIYVNYPAQFNKLDVSREKIVEKLINVKLDDKIKKNLSKSIIQWINNVEENDAKIKLEDIEKVYYFTFINKLNTCKKDILMNLYGLEISMSNKEISFKLVKNKSLENRSMILKGTLLEFIEESLKNKEFLLQLKNWLINLKNEFNKTVNNNVKRRITFSNRRSLRQISMEFEKNFQTEMEHENIKNIKKYFEKEFGKWEDIYIKREIGREYDRYSERELQFELEKDSVNELTLLSEFERTLENKIDVTISREEIKKESLYFIYNFFDTIDDKLYMFDLVYNFYLLKYILFNRLTTYDMNKYEFEIKMKINESKFNNYTNKFLALD